jgi:hypothetical protein
MPYTQPIGSAQVQQIEQVRARTSRERRGGGERWVDAS